MPNFRAIKTKNYAVGIRGNYQDSSDCFEYIPKNPYLNQATQKNTCQNILTQKNPEIGSFKPRVQRSVTQRYNVGTMLQQFKTTSQQCCNAVLR